MGTRVAISTEAPDFTLRDFHGQEVRLSQFRGQTTVILVFNRGFS